MNETICAALIAQFNHERENAALYSKVSDDLDLEVWPGFAHWFARQAAEEADHARRIAGYLIDRGCRVVYAPLPAPDWQPATGVPLPLPAVEAGLARERLTTSQINQVYYLAQQLEDPATAEFLLWFVREQIEEERLFADAAQETRRADIAGLMLLDKEKNMPNRR